MALRSLSSSLSCLARCERLCMCACLARTGDCVKASSVVKRNVGSSLGGSKREQGGCIVWALLEKVEHIGDTFSCFELFVSLSWYGRAFTSELWAPRWQRNVTARGSRVHARTMMPRDCPHTSTPTARLVSEIRAAVVTCILLGVGRVCFRQRYSVVLLCCEAAAISRSSARPCCWVGLLSLSLHFPLTCRHDQRPKGGPSYGPVTRGRAPQVLLKMCASVAFPLRPCRYLAGRILTARLW